MKRIDTINARENMFGIGKSGFHDNADLPGQDATYVSPEWFNTVQEELCNLLELRGITLDPASKRQLYDILTTHADLEALADEIETNFIRKSQIVDNLTTNDANKVASARTVKELQDSKFDKNALNNTLTSTSTLQALTAAKGKELNDRFINDFLNLKSENGYQKLPNGLIIQWGCGVNQNASDYSQTNAQTISFPIAFPNACLNLSVSTYSTEISLDAMYQITNISKTNFRTHLNTLNNGGGVGKPYFFAIGC